MVHKHNYTTGTPDFRCKCCNRLYISHIDLFKHLRRCQKCRLIANTGICRNCNKSHNMEFGSGVFCSVICARRVSVTSNNIKTHECPACKNTYKTAHSLHGHLKRVSICRYAVNTGFCKFCNIPHDKNYGSGAFCGLICSNSWSSRFANSAEGRQKKAAAARDHYISKLESSGKKFLLGCIVCGSKIPFNTYKKTSRQRRTCSDNCLVTFLLQKTKQQKEYPEYPEIPIKKVMIDDDNSDSEPIVIGTTSLQSKQNIVINSYK